ncbi:MAG: 4Fe-4S binding protein [Candidatus Poribacteria bacterium]
MIESVISSVYDYFKEIFFRFRSFTEPSITAFCYMFSFGEKYKEVTEQYPNPISAKTADDLPARSRGFLFNDIDKCTGCGACVDVCPVKCIRLETEPAWDESKTWVSVFDINQAKCIFCGICVEICHPNALIHSKNYEGAVDNMNKMINSFGRSFVTEGQRRKWALARKQMEEDWLTQ